MVWQNEIKKNKKYFEIKSRIKRYSPANLILTHDVKKSKLPFWSNLESFSQYFFFLINMFSFPGSTFCAVFFLCNNFIASSWPYASHWTRYLSQGSVPDKSSHIELSNSPLIGRKRTVNPLKQFRDVITACRTLCVASRQRRSKNTSSIFFVQCIIQ